MSMGLLLRWSPSVLAVLVLLAWIVRADADFVDILGLVQERGVLNCGVSKGVIGFSVRDAAGAWSGIDVDFCRAVAAAVLGDPAKVQFIPLSVTDRFLSLETSETDILARNTTWTVAREATFSVIFVGVLYYDSQGFMVRADSPLAHADTLDYEQVCIENDGNQINVLNEYVLKKNWRFIRVVAAADLATARQEFLSGKCSVLTADISALTGMLLNIPDPAAYVIRPERIAKQPLGPLVRWGDGRWVALVRAVYAALIDAEERGLTQQQARAISRPGAASASADYLAETAQTAAALGIAPNWAARAVGAVGNYGEMFERNLGSDSPLKLARGPNRPWTQGGLLYAPPFQ